MSLSRSIRNQGKCFAKQKTLLYSPGLRVLTLYALDGMSMTPPRSSPLSKRASTKLSKNSKSSLAEPSARSKQSASRIKERPPWSGIGRLANLCTTQLCGQTLVAQVSSCLVLLDLDLTNDICTALVRELKKQPAADKLQDICGEPLTTYPSACKLLWLIRNVQQVKEAYSRGTLAFGTIDTWLAYKLNGGPKKNVFVSDPTNASRTMFMNIRTLQYDETLLGFFGLDRSKIHLPEIVRSSHTTAYGALSSGTLPWPYSQVSLLTVSRPQVPFEGCVSQAVLAINRLLW